MWSYLLIAGLFGLILGYAATKMVLSKELKQVEYVNEAIRQKNLDAERHLETLTKEEERVKTELETAQKSVNELNQQFTELSATILQSQQEKDQIVQNYYDSTLNAAKKNIQMDIEQLEQNYIKAKQDYEQQYLLTLEEATKDFNQEITDKSELLKSLNITLQEEKAKVNAAVEANKRAVELEQQTDFYRLIISDIDLQEIKELRAVAYKLRNSEPLNKVIWKVYYERPYTDLVGRVIGSGVHCGIYKITNIENGMCYIGQAVNIAERWKQHIKRGLGADPPTRNKLYPAMLTFGVENFTFEIIEECDRILLNTRELYWQDYFKAKEFGYSIK